MRSYAHLSGRGQCNPRAPIKHQWQLRTRRPASGTRRLTDEGYEHHRGRRCLAISDNEDGRTLVWYDVGPKQWSHLRI